jgi:hypothetical protein
MYPHSNGLVFVSRPTRVHVLLLEHIKAVWLQDFASRMPGYPDLGPCIVVLGNQPCCGLLPALHMTDNCHIAIPLRGLSKVRRLWLGWGVSGWGTQADTCCL